MKLPRGRTLAQELPLNYRKSSLEAFMNARRLHRAMANVFKRMSPLQREVADALIAGEDWGDDDVIAERYGMTPGAIRIERAQARRFLREALGSELARVW